MADTRVTAQISVLGGQAARAEISAFRAELQSLSAMKSSVAFGVDTSAIKAAQSDVANLRMAHQSLGGKPVVLGVDSSALARAKGDISGLSVAHRALGASPVSLGMDTRGLEAARTSISGVRSALQAMQGDALGAASGFLRFGVAATGVAVIGAGLAVATREAAQFQQTMANLQSVLHAPANDLGNLGSSIQQSAKDTIFTMAGIAEADRQLAKAGQDANQIIREQSDVLALASATQVSAAEGATAYVTAMKGFNLTATDSKDIADSLAKAVDSSVGTLADMADALKQVGPVAQQAGLDIKTTTTAIAALENSGLQGDSGTALKVFLQRLQAPTKEAQAAMADLGLQVYDTRGNLLALGDIFDQIRQKTRGLSDEQKNSDLTKIFGARGVRVADIASTQGADGLREVSAHEETIGSAAEIAAAKLDTLQGQVHQLTSSLSVLGTSIGTALLPQMTDLAKGATAVANGLSSLFGGDHSKKIFEDSFKGIGLDDPNAIESQLAHINMLHDKLADAHKRDGDFKHLNIPYVGQINPTLDDTKAEIEGLNRAIDDEEKLVARAKKLQADSPTLALHALNQNISTITNEQTSSDARAGRGADAFPKIAADADKAKSYIDAFKPAFLSAGGSIQDWQKIESDAFHDIEVNSARATASVKADLDALENHYIDVAQKRADFQKQGIPDRLINIALNPDDFGASNAQSVQAKQDIAELQKTNAAYETARKQAATDFYTDQRQHVQDLAAMHIAAGRENAADEKANATAIADANIKGSKEVEAAWKNAESEVGKVDISKGLAGLAVSAAGLDKVTGVLDKMGQSSPALTALTAIARGFKEIADATDKASAAFDGYMLPFTETDKAIKQIETLKKRYDDLSDAAEKRIVAGTATDNDRQIAGSRHVVDRNAEAAIAKLTDRQEGDLFAAVKVVPDFTKLDSQMRDKVRDAGGGEELIRKVRLDKEEADRQIKEMGERATNATIKLQVDAKDAITEIERAAKDRTMTIQAEVTEATRQINDLARDRDTTLTVHVKTVGIMPGGYSPYDEPTGSRTMPSANPAASAGDDTAVRPGFNQFHALDKDSYEAIVRKGQGDSVSPFLNPGFYEALIKSARESNIDPRALLTATQFESNNGTNSSAGLRADNNFGGIGWANQPGARQGQARPANEGGYYAAFDSPQTFFDAEAKNMSTGAYKPAYDAGDFEAVRRRYVVGGTTPGSDDQERNIRNTVATYQGYARDYPYRGEGEGAGGYSPQRVAASEHLTQQQAVEQANDVNAPPASGASSPSLLATAQKHLGDKVNRFGQDVYGKCEQIVDDIMQESFGKDARWVSADAHVRAAEAGAPGAGRVVSAKDARAGDLVGWTGDTPYAGDPNGHIGVYSGNGNYIGTTTNGVQERKIGPGAVFIRPDGVVADGPVPGATMYGGAAQPHGATYANSEHGQAADAPAANGDRVDWTKGASNVKPLYDASSQALLLGRYLHDLDSSGIQRVNSEMNKFGQYAKQVYDQQFPTDKATAQSKATEATLNYTVALADALRQARNPANDLAAAFDKLRQTGGAMADSAIRYISIQRNINEAQQTNTRAGSEIADIDKAAKLRERARRDQDAGIATAARATQYQNEDADRARAHSQQAVARADEDADRARAHAQQATARADADADRQRSRAHTLDSRRVEDARQQVALRFREQTRGIEETRRAEDRAWTQESRHNQDRQRDLQWTQSLHRSDLQDRLVSLQKEQQSTVYQRTSAEQVVAARVKGAGTNQEAAAQAANLAGMHDADLATRDANVRAVDDLQEQIRLEGRRADEARYNLETETIAEGRAHEDRLRRLDDQGRALTDSQQAYSDMQSAIDKARSRSQEDEQFAIDAARTARARAAEDEQAGIDAGRTARARASEDEQAGIELTRSIAARKAADDAVALADARQAEDDADASRKEQLQAVIDRNNDLIKGWQADQQALDGIGGAFDSIANSAGVLVGSANAIAQAAGQAGNGGQLPVAAPEPDNIRRLSGVGAHAAGGVIPLTEGVSLVGDAPGGVVTPYSELISAPGATVTPIRQLMGTAAGNTINMNAPITITIADDGDAWMAEARRQFEVRLQQVKRELARSASDKARAVGA